MVIGQQMSIAFLVIPQSVNPGMLNSKHKRFFRLNGYMSFSPAADHTNDLSTFTQYVLPWMSQILPMRKIGWLNFSRDVNLHETFNQMLSTFLQVPLCGDFFHEVYYSVFLYWMLTFTPVHRVHVLLLTLWNWRKQNYLRRPQVNWSAGKNTCGCRQKSPQVPIACGFCA